MEIESAATAAGRAAGRAAGTAGRPAPEEPATREGALAWDGPALALALALEGPATTEDALEELGVGTAELSAEVAGEPAAWDLVLYMMVCGVKGRRNRRVKQKAGVELKLGAGRS